MPIVPGHESIGVIEAVGDGVDPAWRVDERAGVGFLGGQDNACESCRRGDFVNCSDPPRTGTDVDGGYAEVTYARAPASCGSRPTSAHWPVRLFRARA